MIEELLFAADDHSRDPATRVREVLGSRGLHEATLLPQPARWFGLWQVVNDRGEEFVTPVASTVQGEPVLRQLPTGPMQTLDEESPAWAVTLEGRPDPGEDTDQMIQAARATFDAAESEIVLVRLVWVGIVEFGLQYRGHSFSATQILGTDRVLLAALPAPEPAPQANHERLLAFGAFSVGALLFGLLVTDPVLRLMAESGWLTVGALYWWVRRDLGAWR